jgi:hypothetical protein
MSKSATAPAQSSTRRNTHPNYTTSADAAREFADAVYSDIGASIQPIPDGELHRFREDGGKAGNKNGWYCLYGDGVPAGSYGSWKTGKTFTWCAKSRNDMSAPEKLAHQRRKLALLPEPISLHPCASASLMCFFVVGLFQSIRLDYQICRNEVKADMMRGLPATRLMSAMS